MLNKTTQILLEASKWFVKLVYLNFLWIIFLLLGGIVLGIGPATYALYQTCKFVFYDNKEEKLSFLFWGFYKEKFITGQWLFYGIVTLLSLLIANIYLIFTIQFKGAFIVGSFLIGIFIVILLPILYFYPVLCFYDEKIKDCILITFYISFSHLKYSILLVSGVILLIILSLLVLPLFIFIFMSAIAMWSTWVSSQILPKYT